jgi:streptomycin 6-kinase
VIEIPARFAADTIAREGDAGAAWIAGLPRRIANLCRRWSLEVCGAPMHGYVAVVVPVRRRTDRFALKVSWVDPSTADEVVALRAWAGRGAVEIVDAEPGEGALLLEWLDPGRSLAHLPAAEAVAAAADLLGRTWIPAPSSVELRSVDAERRSLVGGVRARWEAHDRPTPREWVEWAVGWDGGETGDHDRIVNQDLHYENVLAGVREPWLVIDPKPLRGPAEFAVAPLLWNRAGELEGPGDLESRLGTIVQRAGLDGDRARGWAAWRMIEAGLWALEHDDRTFFETSRRLVGWLFDGGDP